MPLIGPAYGTRRGSWVCTVVSGVRVCTAHLAPSSQTDSDGRRLQPAECGYLRDRVLGGSAGRYSTVFAGDTNITKPGMSCAPVGFWGLHDLEAKAADRTPTSGLQHAAGRYSA
ncbi:hypothetical protein GCM10029978_006830 [Actinoallomurus acanthiterrae]